MKTCYVVALAGTLPLAGCGAFPGTGGGGSRGDPAVETPQPPVITQRWTATLQPMSGSSASGSATITAQPSRTQAEVSISGAPPNDLLPWHVHSGQCASSGPVVGQAHRYTFLTTDASGSGRLTVGLGADAMPGGPLYADVHRSRGDQTVIACGDLR